MTEPLDPKNVEARLCFLCAEGNHVAHGSVLQFICAGFVYTTCGGLICACQCEWRASQPEPATADSEGRVCKCACKLCGGTSDHPEHPLDHKHVSAPPDSQARKAAERIVLRGVLTDPETKTAQDFERRTQEFELIITEAYAPLEAELQRLRASDAEDNATQFRLTDELAKANESIADANRMLMKASTRIGILELDREALRLEAERLRHAPNPFERGYKQWREAVEQFYDLLGGESCDIQNVTDIQLSAKVTLLIATKDAAPCPITPEVREKLIDELAEYLQGAIFKGEARMPKDEADRIIEILGGEASA